MRTGRVALAQQQATAEALLGDGCGDVAVADARGVLLGQFRGAVVIAEQHGGLHCGGKHVPGVRPGVLDPGEVERGGECLPGAVRVAPGQLEPGGARRRAEREDVQVTLGECALEVGGGVGGLATGCGRDAPRGAEQTAVGKGTVGVPVAVGGELRLPVLPAAGEPGQQELVRGGVHGQRGQVDLLAEQQGLLGELCGLLVQAHAERRFGGVVEGARRAPQDLGIPAVAGERGQQPGYLRVGPGGEGTDVVALDDRPRPGVGPVGDERPGPFGPGPLLGRGDPGRAVGREHRHAAGGQHGVVVLEFQHGLLDLGPAPDAAGLVHQQGAEMEPDLAPDGHRQAGGGHDPAQRGGGAQVLHALPGDPAQRERGVAELLGGLARLFEDVAEESGGDSQVADGGGPVGGGPGADEPGVRVAERAGVVGDLHQRLRVLLQHDRQRAAVGLEAQRAGHRVVHGLAGQRVREAVHPRSGLAQYRRRQRLQQGRAPVRPVQAGGLGQQRLVRRDGQHRGRVRQRDRCR